MAQSSIKSVKSTFDPSNRHTYHIGDKGTFFGGLPGEPVRELNGEIVKIMECANHAILFIKTPNSQVKLIRI